MDDEACTGVVVEEDRFALELLFGWVLVGCVVGLCVIVVVVVVVCGGGY